MSSGNVPVGRASYGMSMSHVDGSASLMPFSQPRLPKHISRAVQAVEAEIARDVTRIDGVALKTHRALDHLDLLTIREASIAQRDPIAAERASSLIEDFVTVSRIIIRSTARGA